MTETEPLMAYVESIPIGLDASQLEGLRGIVEAHLERFGALYLNKDTGLLVPVAPGERRRN